MRMRRAQQHRMRLVVQEGVVDKLAVAAQQARILETLNTLADSELLHGVVVPLQMIPVSIRALVLKF